MTTPRHKATQRLIRQGYLKSHDIGTGKTRTSVYQRRMWWPDRTHPRKVQLVVLKEAHVSPDGETTETQLISILGQHA